MRTGNVMSVALFGFFLLYIIAKGQYVRYWSLATKSQAKT